MDKQVYIERIKVWYPEASHRRDAASWVAGARFAEKNTELEAFLTKAFLQIIDLSYEDFMNWLEGQK